MKLFICKKSLIVIIALIFAFGGILGVYVSVSSTFSHNGERTIVIDAGHGGVDGGVVGVRSKIKESDLNLSIAKYLRGYLVDGGFNVVLTRTTQGGLYGTSTKGFKMRDMKKRKEIIEKSKCDMLISIHQNFCPIPSKRGGTVFFEKNSQNSKLLAESIQNNINELDKSIRQNSTLVGDYYILKCSQSPSVIVECGFLSNEKDEELLVSEQYQKTLAYAIFKGCISCFS